MRLTTLEREAIVSEIEKFLSSSMEAEIYLFGSRTNDQLSGGDIDLILLLADSRQCFQLQKNDFRIISALKANPVLGDQKIDLKIISSAQLDEPFYAEAMKHALLLR